MNSPAREAILQRLRRGTPGGARPAPENPVRRFDWSPEERLRRFIAALTAVRGEVILV